ncbi:MAG: 2-nitropropane dioxygenase, partial [Microcystis sp. M49629_WE12]|nr:2-nitropropane dioxygenase [Microcystis sp. M49629_WE12]
MLTSHNPLTSSPKPSISFDSEGIREKLANLEQPCYVYVKNNQIGLSHEPNADILPRSMINALSPQQ